MRESTMARQQASIRKVLNFITHNLHEPCTLQQLSRVACFAPFHFHRIFRLATGLPVHDYVRRLRLEFSAYLLLFSTRPIIEIALRIGYQSNEAFTRAFQHMYGMSPSQFRAAFSGGGAAESATETGCALTRNVAVEARTMGGECVAFRCCFGSYTEVRSWWTELRDQLLVLHLRPEMLRAVGVVYDDPCCTEGSRIRYDACVVLPADLPPVEGGRGLGLQVLPQRETAVLSHRGPAALTPQMFVRLSNTWAMRNPGRTLRRLPYYEVYHHFPFADGRDEVEVDVHVSLAG
jgi:AraC family transcriptional regulator